MKPGGERRSFADGGGLLGQDEKGRLERVFGVGAAVKDAAADVKHEAAVTLDEGRECRLVAA